MPTSVSAVIGNRMICRSIIRNMEGEPPLPGMDSDESIGISFGAMLKQGEKTHITAYEIGQLRSGAEVFDLPEVRKIVSEVLSQLKSAIK